MFGLIETINKSSWGLNLILYCLNLNLIYIIFLIINSSFAFILDSFIPMMIALPIKTSTRIKPKIKILKNFPQICFI